MFSDFLDPDNPDLKPVRDWIKKSSGRIVYSRSKKVADEFDRHKKMRKRVDEYRRGRGLKIVPPEDVELQKKKLRNLRSNDIHIIALAVASGAKVLVSRDQLLGEDFQEHTNGRIYKRREHRHLLQKDIYP